MALSLHCCWKQLANKQTPKETSAAASLAAAGLVHLLMRTGITAGLGRASLHAFKGRLASCRRGHVVLSAKALWWEGLPCGS